MAASHPTSATLGGDFGRLWRSHALSRFGVAFSAGAVAVIAVRDLGASALAVAVALGASRLLAALLSIPVGLLVETRAKRPVLIGCDLLRTVATLAVPILLWLDQLTIVLLGAALAVDTFLSIASMSASKAYLKDLVDRHLWSTAFARLDTTNWVCVAIFTPLGGLVVTLVGPSITLALDALTYLGSAVLLSTITSVERAPAARRPSSLRSFGREAVGGWRYISATPPLRALFANAMVFGGSLVMVAPLLAVLALRDLGLEAWQYATILGAPAVGGVIGAALSPRIERRLGPRTTLLRFGTARTCWTIWIAVSPPGPAGFALILAAECLLMVAAGAFNPMFSAYQAALTDDDHMARVTAAWSATAMTVQPIFMIAGGLLSAAIGVRPTIAVAGVLLLTSAALLPRRTLPDGYATQAPSRQRVCSS